MNLKERVSAQIHLVNARKIEATSSSRSFITEMKGEYDMVYFKETCLGPKMNFIGCVPMGRMRIVVPMAGSLQLTQANECYSLLPGGSVAVASAYEIENSYLNHEIHFLEIDFQYGSSFAEAQLFNLNNRNVLQSLMDIDASTKLLIGKFDGRMDTTLSVELHAEIFTFILGGVFEVQNRLLQEREGLWLKGTSQIEFEGLAKEGIILFLVKCN
ncbi:MAG: hypothetical protein HOP30_10825 [Cyclobacteriaceae bacterium]|nr:hypothetical protein [Cyclobacteriaceae bacterium]